MATSTTRLALIKPAGNEARAVGPLNTNWDTIDKWIGCILVNDGVTPATADLFDGAIVKEKTSGIIWEARKNGGGTFDKVYIRYPFKAEGLITSATGVSTGGALASIACNSLATGGKNDSGALQSGRIQLPIKGIYHVTGSLKWASNATGNRAASFNGSISGDDDDLMTTMAGIATNSLVMHISTNRVYSATDKLTVCGWQTSGGALNVTGNMIRVAMIEPVQ